MFCDSVEGRNRKNGTSSSERLVGLPGTVMQEQPEEEDLEGAEENVTEIRGWIEE